MNSLMVCTVHEMVLEWVGHEAYTCIDGEEEKCTQHFGGDAGTNDTISKTRHTWKVSIKMDLKEIQVSSRKETPFGNKEIYTK
jgi:hypothetical protein